MSRLTPSLGLVASAALLAACEALPPGSAGQESAAETSPSILDMLPPPEAAAESEASESAAPAPPIPHIYLALQPGTSGRPHSAIFAIDGARDGTPSDDPAIRLTPEEGRCNPQEMRRYDFPADAAPVVSEAEQSRGLRAADLPDFLAASVTGRMIEAGLAAEPEDTRALNICTRKLWERLVVAGNRDRVAEGQ
jgi:hypothetical protein